MTKYTLLHNGEPQTNRAADLTTCFNMLDRRTNQLHPRKAPLPYEFGGYTIVEVAVVDTPSGELVKELKPAQIDGAWIQQYEARPFTADELLDYKKTKRAQLAAIRYQHETNHPTLDTSERAQSLVTGAWATCQMNPSATIDFKDVDGETWNTLTKAEIDPLALSVTSWVQDSFSRERVLSEQIDAAVDKAAVDAIDLHAGWPTE